MALDIGQSIKGTAVSTSVTTGSITTAASGSGAVVGIFWTNGRAFNSISDSKSNSWTLIGSNTTVTNVQGRLYYTENLTGGAGHTFSFSVDAGSSINLTVFALEITTTNGNGLTLDQYAIGTDASSPFTSPSISTTIADEMLIGFVIDDGPSGTYTHTAGNSFTIRLEESDEVNNWPGIMASRLVASTGAYNTSTTVSGVTPSNTGNWIASFSETASGGGGSPSPVVTGKRFKGLIYS